MCAARPEARGRAGPRRDATRPPPRAGRARSSSCSVGRHPTSDDGRGAPDVWSRARRRERVPPARSARADRGSRPPPSGCPRTAGPQAAPARPPPGSGQPRHATARARRGDGARSQRARPTRGPGSPVPRAARRPRRREAPSRSPKCSFSTSPSGQYVIPSPYGRQRPVRRTGTGSSTESRSQSSCTSVVFPTPGSPTIVTRCGSR